MAAGQGMHSFSIADLRQRALDLGLDPAPWGRNKRELLKAIQTRERVNKKVALRAAQASPQALVEPEAICDAINRFAGTINAKLHDRCEFYADMSFSSGGSFAAGYHAPDLSRLSSSFGRSKEYETNFMVFTWSDSLRRFLVDEFGDIFSEVKLERGDEYFVDVSVSLK